jgi:phosphate-selective porin OprO/OprP
MRRTLCITLLGAVLALPAYSQAQTKPGNDPFAFQSADGDWQLRVGGYIHYDGRYIRDDRPDPASTFLLRRVRPVISGRLAKSIQFRIMPDFGEGRTVLQDAYAEIRLNPRWSVRGGKFKVPFGQERLQSANDIAFVERALTNNLVPNRDLGVQFSTDWAAKRFALDAGIFNGVPDGGSADADSDSGKELAARLTADVFPATTTGVALRVGIAGTFGDSTAANAGSLKTPGQETFFSYTSGTAGDGSRSRLSPQATLLWRSMTLSSEYVTSRQDLQRGPVRGASRNNAWHLTGRWLVGGTAALNGKVSPPRAADAGGKGAWEIVARASRLTAGGDAFPRFADITKSARSATSVGAGINWYPRTPLKLMLDYERTSFDGGAPAGADRGDEDFVSMRMQINF